jgi:PKD repeat protein
VSKSYTDLAYDIWYFHVRAKNNVGNWGPADHYKVQIENCDAKDDWYCNGDIREYRDYYCPGGSCAYTVTSSENCNDYDGWVDTGDMQWIDDPGNECKEKEQKKQEYQDYFCAGGSCTYSVTDTQWINTGEVRNKSDGTVCGCTANNTLKKCYDGICSGTGICNSTICDADATCDGKKPGEVCGTDSKCNSTCKCICNRPPIASFTYSPLNAAVNETITFNASNSTDLDGFITNYEWDFGDGYITNTTGEIIMHLYYSAGDYTVSLTVTDNDGAKDTTTIELTLAIKGDLNGDGFVTMADVHWVAGMVIGTVEEDLKADFNGNGYVDVGDAAKLLGYVKGKVGGL